MVRVVRSAKFRFTLILNGQDTAAHLKVQNGPHLLCSYLAFTFFQTPPHMEPSTFATVSIIVPYGLVSVGTTICGTMSEHLSQDTSAVEYIHHNSSFSCCEHHKSCCVPVRTVICDAPVELSFQRNIHALPQTLVYINSKILQCQPYLQVLEELSWFETNYFGIPGTMYCS